MDTVIGRIFCCVLTIWLLLCPGPGSAQALNPILLKSNFDSVTVKNNLLALQADFLARIEKTGMHPVLPAPSIIMDNPPSYGNYDDSLNVLRTANWATLSAEEQAPFNRIAGGLGNGITGVGYFEYSVHRWVFIHEMGHWWQACNHQSAESYATEMGANRIATAYWREADPVFSDFMLKRFQGYLKMIPNPVPAGADKEKFLNENYGKLPIPAYIWFQASMIVDAYAEKPVAGFSEAIRRVGGRP